jgi:hypothetical protein
MSQGLDEKTLAPRTNSPFILPLAIGVIAGALGVLLFEWCWWLCSSGRGGRRPDHVKQAHVSGAEGSGYVPAFPPTEIALLAPHRVVLRWRGPAALTCCVELAPEGSAPVGATLRSLVDPPREGEARQVPFDGLLPGRKYACSVRAVNQDYVKLLSFTTPPEPSFENVAAAGKPAEAFAAAGANEGGLAWGDVDGDGRPDIVAAGERLRVYRNEGRFRFTDCTGRDGLDGAARQVLLFDTDLDGRLDIFVTRGGGGYSLYLNRSRAGEVRFEQRTELLPRRENYNTEGAGVADVDGDGWPDLIVTNDWEILVLRNAGAGRPFEDWGARLGLGPEGAGRGNGDYLTMADFNGDGRLDFFYHFGRGTLIVSAPEGFREQPASGVDLPCEGGGGTKFGADAGDLDGDGRMDLVAPVIQGHGADHNEVRVFRNRGRGQFVLDQQPALARLDFIPKTCRLLDLDGDGCLDLYVGGRHGRDQVFFNDGRGRLAGPDKPVLPGLEGTALGLAAADADGDGDLDLAILRAEGAAALLVNHSSKAAARGICRLEWKLPACPQGGRLDLVGPDKQVAASSWVSAGTGWGSQDDQRLPMAAPLAEYLARFTTQDGSTREVKLPLTAGGPTPAIFDQSAKLTSAPSSPPRPPAKPETPTGPPVREVELEF